MGINWTPEAIDSFNRIASNIKRTFTEKEEDNFVFEVQKTIAVIAKFPKSFPKTNLKELKGTRKALIHPHSTLFYKIVNRNKIDLLFFWDNRDNPKKLKSEKTD